MRTPSVMVLADIKWPDGVEVPEQVMRDLCPHIAMHIAEFFAEQCDEHPQLLEGAVKVNWGAPTTPELLAEQLQVREEIDRMTATAEAPEATEEEIRAKAAAEEAPIEGDPGLTEQEHAATTEADTPPARSWAVYQYDSTAVAPAPECHIYGYDESGNPLTEADATELAALLTAQHTGTVMALPNEAAPAITPPASA